MKTILTFFLLFAALTQTTNAHTSNLSHSTLTVESNSIVEFLKGIIEKEGIKSYTVTYTDYDSNITKTYFQCTFPGNNFISFGESGNLSDVGFNLNKLVRYSVFKKDYKNQDSIRRLELSF